MKVNQTELKQDKKDITIYAMKQKCPVCDHQMFFAKYPAIHTTAFFIYCRNCAEETELHSSIQEAAKQWLDMMMIKVEMTEQEANEKIFQQRLMNNEFKKWYQS